VSARPGTKTTRKTARGTAKKATGTGGRLRYNVAPLPDPPGIERRRSSIHRWGVFALETIPKNKRIIDYAGEKITAKQSSPREERYLKQGHIWCFTLNRNWAIDAAVNGNIARFINHACRGNCYVQITDGVIWIRASRKIRKGEELSYNYHTEGAAEIPCRCRPGCQGML
jgi:SET domain-containing protein